VPADYSRGLVEYKIQESDDYYTKKNYPEALRKLMKPLGLEPAPPTALKKSGS